jgi:hypothetical protein
MCDECSIRAVNVHNGVWYDKECDLDICGYCMREKISVGLVEKKLIQMKMLKETYQKY